MAIVQTVTSGTAALTLTVASTAAGNTLMLVSACAGSPTQGATAVTDNKGNTWTKIDGANGAGGTTSGTFWYSPNALAAVTTLTITYNNTTSSGGLVFREYSGLTSAPLDVHVIEAFQNTGTTLNSGPTASTTQAFELVIGWAYASAIAVTAGAGYGNFTNSNTSGVTANIEDMTVITIGTQTAAFVGTAAGVCGCATFKMSGNPPGSGSLGLLGAGT